MLDKDLFFAENSRVGIIPAPNVWGSAVFPSLVAPNYWDFRVLTDLARGKTVYANFRLATPFNNEAGNFLRFAVFVSNDPLFIDVLTNAELCIAQAHEISSLGLVDVGQIVQIAIPPFGDLTRVNGEGRLFLGLGYRYLVPTTDWTQGGIDAFLTDKPLQLRPLSVASGY